MRTWRNSGGETSAGCAGAVWRLGVPVVIVPAQISAQIRTDLGGPAGAQVVVPMTCVRDHQEHAVIDTQVAASSHGVYTALCSHLVLPGSLSSPPGRPCTACVALLRLKATRKPTDARSATSLLGAAIRRLLASHDTRPHQHRRLQPSGFAVTGSRAPQPP